MTRDNENASVSEFLNPKSMLTPGICGAVIMVIVNALGSAFVLTGATRGIVCLGLSFLAGTLVFAAGVKKFWPRLAYYVFNSLIIFSAAAGVNFSGQVALGDTGSETNTVTNTVVEVRYVTNGPSVLPPPDSVVSLATNQIPAAALPEMKPAPKFFQQWK